MPRPRGPARDQVLDAATGLLLERGFEATALDEVCSRAGVTKGALYYHFESKEALAAAAVERFFHGLVAAGQQSGGPAPADPVTALQAYLRGIVALLKGPPLDRGCLLGAMALETPTTHPTVAAAARRALGQWRSQVVGLIDAAAKHRAVRANAGQLADALLAAIEGGLLLDRSNTSNPAAIAAVTHFARYLELLLTPKGER